MHSTYGVHIQQTILSFEALPGLDTVQSSLSIRATPDLFVGGKLKMRCSATMFDLYDMSKEEEIQEDAPQLALIMVPTVSPSKGTTFQMGFCRYTRMSIFLYFVHIHAWLRNVLNQ